MKIANKNPQIFQYIPFKVGTPYISAFDAMGNRKACQVNDNDIKLSSKLSSQLDKPVLSYENGVYCWSWGADCIFLFVEPDLAEEFEKHGTHVQHDQFVPMTNGETLLTFPSLIHLRNTSYLHQKAKIATLNKKQNQK